MTKTVLIVDDEPDIREIARMCLESVAGWKVLDAPDGRTGAELAVGGNLDMVLLDVMMPDLDGPATLARIREQAPPEEVPVIFLTAKSQALDEGRVHELGAQGVIAKPFDPMSLHLQISSLLGW